jgi:hypothetical protein
MAPGKIRTRGHSRRTPRKGTKLRRSSKSNIGSLAFSASHATYCLDVTNVILRRAARQLDRRQPLELPNVPIQQFNDFMAAANAWLILAHGIRQL